MVWADFAPADSASLGDAFPNTAVWIRADTGVTTNANGVTLWNDLSGNNNTFFGGGGATIQA